ncbi:MAG: hypothetical protein LQ350_008574 [Teloschistes chrysophthalmus]|nr:MAG: hypothetical protein LQ350_008574 [Niorma chrysophthalma]
MTTHPRPDLNLSEHLLSAISTNDLSTLRTHLETQDRALLTSCARSGTPETATYLLSRLPPSPLSSPPIEDSSHHTPEELTYLTTPLPSPSPTYYPFLFLLKESARAGNVPLFRALASQHPKFLSTHNRNVESVLVCAMEGGAGIWGVVLEHDHRFMDHEFHSHGGCVLEVLVRLGGGGMEGGGVGIEDARRKKKATMMALLEFLLEQGADTEREGEPILPTLRALKADHDVVELVERYSNNNRKSRALRQVTST